MVLVPTSKGTLAYQLTVPDAVPAAPPELLQVTWVTATLSLAVPDKTIDGLEVEMMLTAGLTMVNDGAVVSFAGDGTGGEAGPVGDAGGSAGGGVDGCGPVGIPYSD